MEIFRSRRYSAAIAKLARLSIILTPLEINGMPYVLDVNGIQKLGITPGEQLCLMTTFATPVRKDQDLVYQVHGLLSRKRLHPFGLRLVSSGVQILTDLTPGQS